MSTQPFTISKRIHPQHFTDSRGGGQANHTLYINGRPFYFEWFWNADGVALLRVRTLVPNPTPYIAEGWQTIHEFTTTWATPATPAPTT
ncbi:hypothetical protein OG413_20590 [Streptomyces sp. NBC_01433]|uniref:hypothetical protein n=1 Tax=Streptomyces sp. NBC_01433 TaxID=2903864 RepID=UPI00225128F1|nr:hypothetical protein [Streptomyces sp. NBC_01433]MCX4677673.1 hypothetical protein [Streptomyces sp. NBC_01433]